MSSFDVYGFQFTLNSENAGQAIADVSEDFAFFRRDSVAAGAMPVVLHGVDPPYDTIPQKPATVYTPRNISFTDGSRTYVDYSGRALAIFDRAKPSFDVYSRDGGLLYEVAYLYLLSRIGEYLDTRGLHRIHSMALSYDGKAVLAIFPMGGGKSTLAMELLKSTDFKILSDDSPFLARNGGVLAFPLRLGFLPGGEAGVPAEHRRTINRIEFGPKVLVNYSFFADRVAANAAPGVVFLGERSLAKTCRIEPIGTLAQYRSIIVNCVVGLGLYQGLEFVMRSNPIELVSKAGVAFSRFRNARALFRRAHVCRLILGRDHAQNAEAVSQYVRKVLASNASGNGK
jgi:hypothetical protein